MGPMSGVRGVAPGRPACQRATRVLRFAPAPSGDTPPVPPFRQQMWALRPAWTGASRPFTPSRGGRVRSGRWLGVHGPVRRQAVANAGGFLPGGHQHQAASHYTAGVRLSRSRRAHLDACSCAAEASNWRRPSGYDPERLHGRTGVRPLLTSRPGRRSAAPGQARMRQPAWRADGAAATPLRPRAAQDRARGGKGGTVPAANREGRGRPRVADGRG